MKHLITILFVLPLVLYGKLETGSEVVTFYNQYDGSDINNQLDGIAIDFDLISNGTPNMIRTSRELRIDDQFYSCTTNITNADIYILENEFTTCAYPCRMSAGVGSPRVFYQVNKELQEVDYSKPFILTDTSLFLKIDSVRQNYTSELRCYVPFINVPEKKFDSKNVTLVISTDQNRYVLLQIKPIYRTFLWSRSNDPDLPGETYTVLDGYKITWYLQSTPKTTDFSSISNVTLIKNYSQNGVWSNAQSNTKKRIYDIGFSNDVISRKATATYTLQGMKVDISDKKLNNKLIIYKK